MEQKNMIKALIFDMDGTITLTEELHHRAYATIFKDFGITFTQEEEARRFAGSGSKNIFETVFKENNVACDEALMKKCIDRKRALYTKLVQETEVTLVPGIREFLKKSEELGLKRIIATGNSDLNAVRFILERASLLHFFPQIVSISEVPHGKPAPDVFLEAAHRLAAQPSECVVFEDSLNGVEAAVSAGIMCIALETTSTRDQLLKAGAKYVVPHYDSITNDMLYGTN